METSNQVLDAVLDDFSLPQIEERFDRDFFYQLELKFPVQYGIACRDVTDCVRRAEALGAGPFIHATVLAPNWVENGKWIRRCKLEVALGYAGDMQIELLGPGQGTEHYARALVDRDIAFHHVGIFQRGIDPLGQTLARAGYPEVVRGGVAIGKALRIDFRYFDSRAEHDVYLELLDFSCLGIEFSLAPLLRTYAKLRDTLPL